MALGLGMSLHRFVIRLLAGTAALPGALPFAHAADKLDVEIKQTGDDSYAARIETRLPAGLQAEVGMDFAAPEPDVTTAIPDIAGPLAETTEPATVAWSAVSAPMPSWLLGGEASLRTQVDPGADTAGIVGTITHTRPIGDYLSASLVDDVTLTETGVGTPDTGRSWEANRSVRLDIKPTGTALIARGQMLGADRSVHTYLTAEQTLAEGLGLTTSLSDFETGDPVLNVGARFNRRW
jgi:hypothetical protein